MRCNACWRELEGKAVATTCGHLLCTEDASKILNNDASCPVCDQVLSKNLMRPMDISPHDDWINMAMAGVSPQILMKSAYRSVMFFVGQKELEMQYKMNRAVAQFRQKCALMQEKYTEKLEQLHTAYQKTVKRCQMMQQEMENLSKDNQELQEKFADKSRQKRKLEEMYEQLRNEYESMKRSALQPINNLYPRADSDLFPNHPTMMESRDPIRKGRREDIWMGRQNSSNSGPFDIPTNSPANHGDHITRPALVNPSITLRNLILSPIKRPQLSRNRPNLFNL